MEPDDTGHMGQACWHVHHDKLCEVLTEPIVVRERYIRKRKPTDEIEVRIRLMKPVVGPLPPEVELLRAPCEKAHAVAKEAQDDHEKARATYGKTWADYERALTAHNEARAEYNKALNSPEMDALHATECPSCPWDGETILGRGGRSSA